MCLVPALGPFRLVFCVESRAVLNFVLRSRGLIYFFPKGRCGNTVPEPRLRVTRPLC